MAHRPTADQQIAAAIIIKCPTDFHARALAPYLDWEAAMEDPNIDACVREQLLRFAASYLMENFSPQLAERVAAMTEDPDRAWFDGLEDAADEGDPHPLAELLEYKPISALSHLPRYGRLVAKIRDINPALIPGPKSAAE